MEWTVAGKKYTKTQKQRGAILDEITWLEWHDLVDGLTAPMGQGLALKQICQEIRGRHKRLAWNGYHNHTVYEHRTECYGLYGLETHYKGGVCKSYWLDIGTETLCVCHNYAETQKEK